MLKKQFFICIFFSITVCIANAQLDRTIEGFSIKPSDSLLNGNKSFTFKMNPVVGLTFKNAKHKINYTPLTNNFKKSSGVDISAKSSLVTKEWEIKQKFDETKMHPSVYRRDYYLGDLKTKSDIVILKCRDFGQIDGDRVNVLHGKAIAYGNITLQYNYHTIQLELKEGFNEIGFQALNNGELGVNTAELLVYDKNGKLLSTKYWHIAANFKATLMILKE